MIDCFVQLAVDLTVPGIKPIVSGHFEIFFRDVLNQQFNESNGREGLFDKRIVFMFIVVESYIVTVIRINSGKCNDGSPQITTDIFDNGIGITKIWLGVNIKAIFVFMIYFGFRLFEGSANTFFKFIE